MLYISAANVATVGATVALPGTNFPKLPIMPQQSNLNLHIPSPGTAFNIRVAGVQGSKGQTMMTTRGPIMVNTRPAHILTQPVTQVAPQTVQAQVLTPTMLPPGTKLMTPSGGVQVTQAVMANLPLKMASQVVMAGGKINGPAPPTSSTMSLPLQVTLPATALPTQGTLTQLSAFPLSATPLSQPITLVTNVTPTISLTTPTTGPPTVTTPVVVAPATQPTNQTQANNNNTQQIKKPEHNDNNGTSVDTDAKESKGNVENEKEDKPEKSSGENNTGVREDDAEFDMSKTLDWDNGIGTLPGSDLKVLCFTSSNMCISTTLVTISVRGIYWCLPVIIERFVLNHDVPFCHHC